MTTHAFFDPFGAFAADEAAPNRAGSPRRPPCYRKQVGDGWRRLAATRARFERHAALYTGTMKLHATAGRWVARLCELVARHCRRRS
jgi:hypothetical protein